MFLRPFARIGLLVGALAVVTACAGPKPPAPGPAADRAPALIQVVTTPSGASVIVDGRPTGFRSPTSFPLAAGAHRITLSLDGHGNAEEHVRLGPGDTLRVEAVLTPLAAGSLDVVSVPEGAQIFIDGVSINPRAPAVIHQLAVGTHTVQLRMAEFEDWSQAVVVNRDRPTHVQAVLTPARSSLGALSVQSQPPSARIFLDGFATGKMTPGQLPGVPPGPHRVELELAGHHPWSGSAVVREGHTENLLVTLRPLPAQTVGEARIESTPLGASIRLDGVALSEKTPADLDRIAPGTYTVEISRPDSRPWQGELTVLPGERTLLQVSLDPEARFGGSIHISSEPPGADVAIDGRPTGVRTPSLVANLMPAGYRVEVSLPGHRPWARVVQIGDGAVQTVHALLLPRPFIVSAAVVASRDGVVELSFRVTGHDGPAAPGVLELGATPGSGSWRESRPVLVAGEARAAFEPAPASTQATLSVGLGAQRDLFRLFRNTDGAWETAPAE